VRSHIADPLAPRRDENDDEGDEVSQQTVDKPQDCADRGLSRARHLPGLLIDHPHADDYLAEGLAAVTLHQCEIGERAQGIEQGRYG
jgi:hypothetical protein